MARVIDTREMNENVLGEDVPVYMVAVDAETYEEARAKAIEQYRAYLAEKQEQMRNTNDELMRLFAGLY
jgi:hypothetical protein